MKQRFTEVEVPGVWSAAHWTTPLTLKARGMPNIHTIHDLIPLQFPHFVVDVSGRSARLHASIAQHSDHIVTDSETSKRKIIELLHVHEDRVSVTYMPVPRLPTIAREDAERLVRTVYGAKPGEYALYVGAIEPRKNLKRLIEAVLISRADIPLLIAGPLGWLYADDVALIDSVAAHNTHNGQQPPVRRLGYLPRGHLVALIQCARFFVFPSIYEGFGLPVLEAMQLGVPVLTSTTSSLPEVAGEAAVLVDPLDVGSIAREIRRLASDDDLRAELARRGPAQAAKFSREGYQARLAAAYRKVGVELGDKGQAMHDSGPAGAPAQMARLHGFAVGS
jgi:glycosyltransferase involved in cell wall biosynthesis